MQTPILEVCKSHILHAAQCAMPLTAGRYMLPLPDGAHTEPIPYGLHVLCAVDLHLLRCLSRHAKHLARRPLVRRQTCVVQRSGVLPPICECVGRHMLILLRPCRGGDVVEQLLTLGPGDGSRKGRVVQGPRSLGSSKKTASLSFHRPRHVVSDRFLVGIQTGPLPLHFLSLVLWRIYWCQEILLERHHHC